MRRFLLLLALVGACTPSSGGGGATTAPSTWGSSSSSAAPPSSARAPIVKATSCRAGPATYLGFRGTGAPPPELLEEILKRFPDAQVTEVGEGKLGVITAEPHSWDVRGRHEAAAEAVGWKGDVVDFPTVTADCAMAFHTPPPPPH